MSYPNKVFRSLKLFSTLFFLIIIVTVHSNAQDINTGLFQYLSPVPGSRMISPGNNIIIRYGENLQNIGLENNKLIEVMGSISGLHTGRMILSDDYQTIVFNPDNPFALNETVTVKLNNGLKTVSGEPVPSVTFHFKISPADLNSSRKTSLKNLFGKVPAYRNKTIEIPKKIKDSELILNSLPEDFPEIIIDTVDNPAPGYFFLASFPIPAITSFYQMIIDNHGQPVFYRKTAFPSLDFKKQINGYLTYFDFNNSYFYMLDSSYAVIDSFTTGNGYPADGHELNILPNGHALLMSYDYELVPMDTVVPGGDPDATVVGLIIQELDNDKNVVFQWRSWDHFKITDATFDIDLTAEEVDYVHGNAIEEDYDGNLLISSRHMDEVTKIDKSGEIIWRLGGEYCENNQFQFINDPIGFSHQHDVRRLENGNLTVFDNGNLHDPPFSRSVEYQLDEQNKICVLVWEHSNDPESYSVAMGDSRRLPNHNTVIGWGLKGDSPDITEVRADGTTAYSLSLPDTVYSYRGLKFDWKTNLFVSDPDSIFFDVVPLGDSASVDVTLHNNSNEDIIINGFYNRELSFSVEQSLPFTLPASGTFPLTVKFNPQSDGYFSDVLHIRSDREDERIAQVLPLAGRTDSTFTNVGDEIIIDDFALFQNYPNPFNPVTNIEYKIPEASFVSLKIYDLLGREAAVLVNEEKPAGLYRIRFDGTNFASGVYIYRLQAGDFSAVKKLMLMK